MDYRHRDPFADVALPRPFRVRREERNPSRDPYYGRRDFAELCARFVTHLFPCPGPLSTTRTPSGRPYIPLERFIAFALNYCSITNDSESVVFSALYLLQRLKMRYPAAKDADAIAGHRMFLSAFRIVSQPRLPTYHWLNIGQGLFSRVQIQDAGRDLRDFLDNYVEIDAAALREFERRVRNDFAGRGPYPDYAAEALAASRRKPPRRAASAPPAPDSAATVVDRGRSLAPHTPGLSTSAASARMSVAGTARPQKLSMVPQPGAFYAKPQGYLW